MENILEGNIEPSSTEKKSYPSIGQAFGMIGVLILITIVVSLLMELVRKASDPGFNSLLNCLTYTLSMFLFLIFGVKMRRSRKFSWNRVSMPILLLCIPLILSLGILVEPLINAIPMPELIRKYFNSVITNDIYSFVMIAIAAPLLEELVFRGIVLDGLLKHYSPVKAIIWSAAIFGIAHLNPWQFLSAFSLGLVIGWLYWKTNSLIPGIAIHFINNSLSFLMMMVTGDSLITTQQFMGDGKAYYVVYGMCIPIFVGSLFLIQQRLKMKEV